MRAWYIPSATGDFRLEVHPDTNEMCLLTVEDPTIDEQAKLEKFLKKCVQYKWTDADATFTATGRTEIPIDAPILKCGSHLAKEAMPSRGTLTVIKSTSGKIMSTVDGKDLDPATDFGANTEEKADAATTVKRPTTCCPDPVEGPLKRSSRVLREFCTPRQWNDWVKYGFLLCRGGSTNYVYRLVHRHSPLAKAQGKICADMTHRGILKFWDWSIPPAEEVLSAKLILEHREPWLRNGSTVLGNFERGRGTVFHNPLGSMGMDGTWDAAFFRTMGDPLIAQSMAAGLLAGAAFD